MAWWVIMLIAYGGVFALFGIVILIVLIVLKVKERNEDIKFLFGAFNSLLKQMSDSFELWEQQNDIDATLSTELNIHAHDIAALSQRIDALEAKSNKKSSKSVDKNNSGKDTKTDNAEVSANGKGKQTNKVNKQSR